MPTGCGRFWTRDPSTDVVPRATSATSLGVLILAVQFIWKFAQQVWPALVVGSFGDNVLKSGLIGVSILIALSSAYAVVYYLRFKFSVEGEVLVVEKGVLRRERLQVPFERIQTIQLFQGPLQQVFRLTGVRVDTAGSSGSELQLVAIRKSEAAELQSILRQTGTVASAAETSEADPSAEEGEGANWMPHHPATHWCHWMQRGCSRWGSPRITCAMPLPEWPWSSTAWAMSPKRSPNGWRRCPPLLLHWWD